MQGRRKRQLLATNTLLNSGVRHHEIDHDSQGNLLVVRLSSSLHVRTTDESLHRTYGLLPEGEVPHHSNHKKVTWSSVNVREYERLLGDNPSCLFGPPIGIGWSYNDQGCLDLDTFESSRPPRRTTKQMLLPRAVRQDMLMQEWNVSRGEIAAQIRRNTKIKNQRKITVQRMDDGSDKVVNGLEYVVRKIKKSFRRKSNQTSFQVSQMQKQADRAAAVLAQMAQEEQDAAAEDDRHSLSSSISSASSLSSWTTTSSTSSSSSSSLQPPQKQQTTQSPLLPPLVNTEIDAEQEMQMFTLSPSSLSNHDLDDNLDCPKKKNERVFPKDVVIEERSSDFLHKKDSTTTTAPAPPQEQHQQTGGQDSGEDTSSSSPQQPQPQPPLATSTTTTTTTTPNCSSPNMEDYRKLAHQHHKSLQRLKSTRSSAPSPKQRSHPSSQIVITESD